MDPDVCLKEIRELIADLRRQCDQHWEQRTPEEVDDLVSHVKALDKWLSNGGFLPAAWQRLT